MPCRTIASVNVPAPEEAVRVDEQQDARAGEQKGQQAQPELGRLRRAMAGRFVDGAMRKRRQAGSAEQRQPQQPCLQPSHAHDRWRVPAGS